MNEMHVLGAGSALDIPAPPAGWQSPLGFAYAVVVPWPALILVPGRSGTDTLAGDVIGERRVAGVLTDYRVRVAESDGQMLVGWHPATDVIALPPNVIPFGRKRRQPEVRF